MLATLKAEFRKILTVRSTYVICLLTLVMIAIFAFWVEGYKGITGSAASQVNNKAVQEIVLGAGSTVGGFISIIAVLFIIHEYRYNTIMYTLTSSNSRSKVLLSKILTLTVLAIIFTLFALLFSLGCYLIGLNLRDAHLPAQDWNMITTVGKVLFYNLATVLISLIVAVIARNIAGSIAFLFLFPNTVEPLLGLLLKARAVYLPFAALERVVTISVSQSLTQGTLSPAKAMGVVSVYLIVAGGVTWLLFLRRDAA